MNNDRLMLFALVCGALLAACTAAPTPTPTLVPSITPSPLPTLQPTATEEPTMVNSLLLVTATPDPLLTPTETPLALQIQPLTGESLPPPIAMTLPEGWQAGYNTYVLQAFDTLIPLRFALYTGPVTGGTGFIVLLWAVPNLSGANPFEASGADPSLYATGLLLLRSIIVEPDCNIGTDVERPYTVGGQPATGMLFSAVACPSGLPDTRGWFAALPANGLNFVFFMYSEPIGAMTDAQPELQAILDSVRFFSAADIQATAAHMPTAAPTP
ncbi:MAG: hypothetical protein HXY40_05230 [Chloroflexi bacterium]|nr:hypothetical protein [Chloroflexota bacterium]